MNLHFDNVEESLRQRLEHLAGLIQLPATTPHNIHCEEAPYFQVCKAGTDVTVRYQTMPQLYRSLLLTAQMILSGSDGIIDQAQQFETMGVMLDMSRGGVMKTEKVKEYIDYLALSGMNRLLLYMEDVFELDDCSYFGYMRGRYTKAELKDIDAYARQYGIEVVPCIQTLGHWEQYIKWAEGAKLSDTHTVLLSGNNLVYEFIEKIILTMSECFTSRIIHIGMDEAWNLGSGNYLKQYGYKDKNEIFIEHIEKVMSIVEKYNMTPLIWSDMYFRMNSKVDEYYDPDVQIQSRVKTLLPENLRLTYWDYYHYDEETYRFMIDQHSELVGVDNLDFAGGIWCWSFPLPDYDHTLKATKAALAVCREKGIRNVFATVWGDDGRETDQFFALPGCLLYGDCFYQKEVDIPALSQRIRLLFGADLGDFTEMSRAVFPTEDRGPSIYGEGALSIKQIVHSDILCGLADSEMMDERLIDCYEILAHRYEQLASQDSYFRNHFSYTASICRFAACKLRVVQSLHAGYPDDTAVLREILTELLPQMKTALTAVKQHHYAVWYTSNKPFGFEIVDGRYGIIYSRIITAENRLAEYLSGKTSRLEELEETRLPYAMQARFAIFHCGIASGYLTRGY